MLNKLITWYNRQLLLYQIRKAQGANIKPAKSRTPIKKQAIEHR